MPDLVIGLGPIVDVPPYAEPLVRTIGSAYLNWGRLEQHLDFLLQHTNDARFVTGEIAKYPDTSFRLKSAHFKRIYAQHPRFKAVHHIAGPVCTGLKKANQSRVRMVHSNFQSFDPGPPPTMRVAIVRFKGADLHPFHGTWSLEALQQFNQLLCWLSADLATISSVVMTEDFRRSLEKELSQTQKAFLWGRRLLSRLPRLRIDRASPRF
jgi:hypothetical protein